MASGLDRMIKMTKKHIIFDCDGTLVDTSKSKYSLFPGIKELLLKLHESSILYVWTARDRLSTLRLLKEFGIHHLFEEFCTMDDAFPKPHIGGLEHLVGEAAKESVCVIGDTTNDILGARAFGVKSIGAVWNNQSHPAVLQEAGADFIASYPMECLDFIDDEIEKGSF